MYTQSLAIMNNLSNSDLLFVDKECLHHLTKIMEAIHSTRKNLPLSLQHANRQSILLYNELEITMKFCKPILEKVNQLK